MFRTLTTAIFFLLLPTVAAALCEGPNLIDALPAKDQNALRAAVAKHPYPEGNIWRAEKPGSTVHVVGTMHLPDPRLVDIADAVRPALESADLLILEATAAMDQEMQRKMVETPEIAFITDGPTLIDLLEEELWTDLSERLNDRGVPPIVAAQYKPWLAAMTLGIPSCALPALIAGDVGLDAMLENMATDNTVQVATLDNIDSILEILSEGTMEEQIDMLKVTLTFQVDEAATFVTMRDSYAAGRHREIWEFNRLLMREMAFENAEDLIAEFEEMLLNGRNRTWEPLIAELVLGKDAVIAVGAMHLSGETGVLRILERRGYTLTRVDG